MPALLMLAPAVIGVVVSILLIRTWPRLLPSLPRRVRILAAVGLGVALAVEVVMVASGSWPFQSMGFTTPLEWLSLIPGDWQSAAPLLGGVIATALQCVPTPSGPRREVAELAPRTPFTFASAAWLLGTGVAVGVAVLLAVTGGLASRPDQDGAYTMWLQDAGLGIVGRLIYGWAFSGPSLLLLLLLTVTTLLGLTLIARPPIAEDTAGDLAARRSRSRAILVTACGAVLIHVGTVLIFFAYTANLSTGVSVGDAVVPVYPPFAVLAPALLGLGIGAIIVGFVLWCRLFIEQLTAIAARHSHAAHAD